MTDGDCGVRSLGMVPLLRWGPALALATLLALGARADDLVPLEQRRGLIVVAQACGRTQDDTAGAPGFGVFADSVLAQIDLCTHVTAWAMQRSSIGANVIDVSTAVSGRSSGSDQYLHFKGESIMNLRFRVDTPLLVYDLDLFGTVYGRAVQLLVKLRHPGGTFEGQSFQGRDDGAPQSGHAHFKGPLAAGEYQLEVHLLTWFEGPADSEDPAVSEDGAMLTLRFEASEQVAASQSTWSRVKSLYREMY